MQRAGAARSALLASHADARVDVLHLDVGSVRSVLAAAEEIKARFGWGVSPAIFTHSCNPPSPLRQILYLSYRYNKIDFLYLNAGIMPNPQVNVKALFRGLFSR